MERNYLVVNGYSVIIISVQFEMEKQKQEARRKKTREAFIEVHSHLKAFMPEEPKKVRGTFKQ